MNASEAVAVVEEDRKTRVQAAAKEIEDVLMKYNCTLTAQPRILDGRIVADIQIAPM